MEYPDDCSTAIRRVVRKVAAVEGGLVYYELRSLGLDDRITLVLSNIRELNRELFCKLVYLI